MPESALRQLVPQSAEPFVRSYNPFNPAFRETMRASISDLLGGRAMGGTPTQRYRANIADMLTGAVEMAPGVGEAVGVTDTRQAIRSGDYGTAAMLGGATALGMVPVIGDAASRAIREGLDMSTAARMQRSAEGAAGIRTAGEAAEGALDVAKASKYVANKMPTGVYSVAGKNSVYSVKPSGNEFIIEYIPQWKSKVKPFQVQGGSIDEVVSLADQRLDRSTNAQKGLAKYQSIPEAWTGEAKKIAKKAIDAGYDPIFSASTQSRSKYMEINGQKIRLSDHDLPLHYDAPDIDFRYGSDIDALLIRLQQEQE